jgi:transcriptional regulator
MCLNKSFFDEKQVRIEKWNNDGLSIKEAEVSLGTLGSSVDLIAFEVLYYIEKQKNTEEIVKLNELAEKFALKI